MTQDLNVLRRELRGRRRGLSPARQAAAASGLLAQLSTRDFFRDSRRVAFYVAVAGEISPEPMLWRALADGKSCFLPVVIGEHGLDFVQFDADASLLENRWGIPEPRQGARAEARSLDLVFVPLVGFTRDCLRLGSGKGYYDRAFAFRLQSRQTRPMLVGLAHEAQRLAALPRRDWDVPLDAVVTPERIYRRDC